MVARKLAGKIVALPNDVTHIKTQKFVFVNVRTDINGGSPKTGSFNPVEVNNLQQDLHQALIHGEFEDYINPSRIKEFSLISDTNFKINTNATTGVKDRKSVV